MPDISGVGGSLDRSRVRTSSGIEWQDLPLALPHPDPPSLTEAEAQLLELVAAGLSTRLAASVLHVSPQAVAYHLGNLLSKFQCQNRAGLISRAFCDRCADAGHLAT